MNDKSHEQAANQGKDDEDGGKTGVTLEDYASAMGLPLHVLEKLGVRTVENPWNERRNAVAIPYRLRDGSVFRDRIWQAVQSGESKARRAVWDRRENKLGGLLYGLDLLPAAGCPILLMDDESACHVLWHHGFDAVGIAGPNGYYARRDDAELEGFKITVLPAAGRRVDNCASGKPAAGASSDAPSATSVWQYSQPAHARRASSLAV
jgi:hypothetical protein